MGASKLGMKKLLPQKRYNKINIACTSASEKTYCNDTIKKSWEELNIGISSLNI